MKLKTLAFVLGLCVFVGVLTEVLISIHGPLDANADKLFDGFMIILVLGELWVTVQLVKEILKALGEMHKTYSEVRTRKQQYQIDGQRWAMELLERQASVHVQLSRVQPGTYLIQPDFRVLPSEQNVLMLPAHHNQRTLPSPDGNTSSVSLPTTIRYEDVESQIPAGHSLLGISANGLETCDFKDLMTMLISGGSSTGKSNTVAIKLHEAIHIGRNVRMLVVDPHKNKPDSLYNKIRPYEHRFLLPVAQKDEEVIKVLHSFQREFERRMELSVEELEELPDILLICDEVYALVNHREDERIKNLIKLVSGIAGYESRGYGMYAWFLTQKVTGLKWLRDAVMTTICHKMQTMSERILASNEDRAVARDMDHWTMPGRVVVFGLNLPVTVAQMPLFKQPPLDAGAKIQPDEDSFISIDEDSEGESDTEELPIDEDLREALEAYNNGATGPRSLMRTLKCTYYQANQLFHRLQTEGLIEVE